ncbi:hypothetical protein E4U58_000696 [Claviceps cyperi]|nr:hypothetical protein E4U58_000696 [Claviceps cyperi]
MRLLTTLTLALVALALATGPVKSTTDQLAVNGDASVNLDDATATEGWNGISKHPTASHTNPAAIAIAGIIISLHMATRWTMAIANGANFFFYRMGVGRIDIGTCPEDAESFRPCSCFTDGR